MVEIVFMFSGQGSQYYMMGKELYSNNSTFKKWMDILDGIYTELTGKSVKGVLYNEFRNKSEVFNDILYTHAAIFMVEYSLSQVLIEKGIKPDYVLGTSLGEFASIAVSNVMSVKDVMECVTKQAELIYRRCCRGCMTAIINNSGLYYETPVLYENSDLVSINYDMHFVVSGSEPGIAKVEKYLKSRRITFQRLPVQYGFHSPLIDSAEVEFLEFIKGKKYKQPQVKFISCMSGNQESSFKYDYLWDVVRNPIEFQNGVGCLDNIKNYIFIDMGPSGTMANFLKYKFKHKNNNIFSIISPFKSELMELEALDSFLPVNTDKCSNLKNDERKRRDMIAYLFPGQGSQYKGMGGELFDEFSELTMLSDRILGYSIKKLCMEDSYEQLGQTQYTQPALYVVNALTYLKKIKDTGAEPDFVAGHSLGEYDALFASGIVDFETGLRLVKKRGELMGKATGGGMAAIIGLQEEIVRKIIRENGLEKLDVANLNTPTQIVISGPKDMIEHAKSFFEPIAKSYVILKVSGAFHSRYMENAKRKFLEFASGFKFNNPKIPIISNYHARPYKQGDLLNTLTNQITNSVKWTESIRYLMGKGVKEFIQIGPGKVVNGMVKAIQSESEPLIIKYEDTTGNAIQEQRVAMQNEQQDISITGFKKDELYVEDTKSHVATQLRFTAESLGSAEFKKDYGIKYAYLLGAMYKGVASKEMVVKAGKSGMMSFFGAGGLDINTIEESIKYIQKELSGGGAYGLNFLHNSNEPQVEERLVDLFLKWEMRNIEASAFMGMTPALVRYRLKGLKRDASGVVIPCNKIIAKISRPEVAERFLSPAPERIINKLFESGKISKEEALLGMEIPMADDLCIEADSGGHTDCGVAYVLMPAIMKLRDEMMKKYKYSKKIRVGAAGGIGTPEAAAAAFMLGADFILTGSINQCTVEAGTSNAVKDLLQQMNVQDTDYAPAGDMFEIGARVQVLKRGLFFSARATKLYDLYRQYNSLEEIDEKTRIQIQEKYFKRSFEDVYRDVKAYYSAEEIEKAEKNPKHKMALIFRWYFGYSTRLALNGKDESKVDFQVHCGPALGAFNQWVKGTPLESWTNRHVDEIGRMLLSGVADYYNRRFIELTRVI